MHPRNRYAGPHDFTALAAIVPELAAYFRTTPDGRTSLDFADPSAVRLLNQALLKRDYGLRHWDLPPDSLCPGVPGRLDYIHVLAELLGVPPPDITQGPRPQVRGKDKNSKAVTGLDVGTGASLIYPILGAKEYGWRFVGTDVDATSLKVAGAILRFNPGLGKSVELRRQPNSRSVFHNVVLRGEFFDFTMCNPPFFDAPEAATSAARKKWSKLGHPASPTLNFGGRPNELWTPGGEPDFLRRMIRESVDFAGQVGWFTTLVSKKGYLKVAEVEFGRLGISERRVIGIGQGGKRRRVLVWRVD